MSHEQTRFSQPMNDNASCGSDEDQITELFQNLDKVDSIEQFEEQERSEADLQQEAEFNSQIEKEKEHQLKRSAYFQGTEEPTPKKKKYKSEPAIVVQPRFKEPFYRNYDLYDTPGEHGPGAGYHELSKCKSILEFRNKKKKLREKYKADDSYKQDDGSITKKKADQIFDCLMKTAIDFPLDKSVDLEPIPARDESPLGGSLSGLSGMLDFSWPEADEEGKKPGANLDFGVDDDVKESVDVDLKNRKLDRLINKYQEDTTGYPRSESDAYGLPDGVSPLNDEDSYSHVMDYGTTNSGNTSYDENNQ